MKAIVGAIDDFLEGKSLRAYLYLCFIPILLILVVGLPRWLIEYGSFAFLVPISILLVDNIALRQNPSEGNKIIGEGLYSAVFFFTAPATIVIFPSGILFWLFLGLGLGLGFLFMYCFVVLSISFKNHF